MASQIYQQLRDQYNLVRRMCSQDWGSQNACDGILHLANLSLRFLNSQCSTLDLVSRVADKNYVSYTINNVVSRPVNKNLFVHDENLIDAYWQAWLEDNISEEDFARMSYTVALAPCLAMELFDRNNKKGPATYFECYIGHIFAKSYGVNPRKRAVLPVQGRIVLMTMDFVFDLGSKKIHLPVKMSTRERVVQAWAHQRLLDAAYGDGEYIGVMVLFSETKLDSRSLEVVEICVPDQWLAYQTLLSKMDRIYYFDVPNRYQDLTNAFPNIIQVKQFGKFFTEIDEVVS